MIGRGRPAGQFRRARAIKRACPRLLFERGRAYRNDVAAEHFIAFLKNDLGTEKGAAVRHLVAGNRDRPSDGFLPSFYHVGSVFIGRLGEMLVGDTDAVCGHARKNTWRKGTVPRSNLN